MTKNKYIHTVYLRSGNVVAVIGCSCYRNNGYTEIYKMSIDGKKEIVARFENEGIEGFVVKKHIGEAEE